jgi:uncharacterized protein YbaR (Trm112 family)
MFIELVDLLRCPRDHEDSWLVAAIHEKSDRDILGGILGCPICGAEYPIRQGVAIFGDTSSTTGAEPARTRYDETDDDAAMRCAAMLDLFDPGGAIILGGTWGRAARALLDITPVSILLVDPPAGVAIGNGLSAIRIGDRLPVAPGSLRGIALDERTGVQTLVDAAVRALKPRGRLVAPVSAAVPVEVTERARDDRHWVGEVGATPSQPIPLTRQRAQSG